MNNKINVFKKEKSANDWKYKVILKIDVVEKWRHANLASPR